MLFQIQLFNSAHILFKISTITLGCLVRAFTFFFLDIFLLASVRKIDLCLPRTRFWPVDKWITPNWIFMQISPSASNWPGVIRSNTDFFCNTGILSALRNSKKTLCFLSFLIPDHVLVCPPLHALNECVNMGMRCYHCYITWLPGKQLGILLATL